MGQCTTIHLISKLSQPVVFNRLCAPSVPEFKPSLLIEKEQMPIKSNNFVWLKPGSINPNRSFPHPVNFVPPGLGTKYRKLPYTAL